MTQINENDSLGALAVLVDGTGSLITLRSPLKEIAPLQASIKREGIWGSYSASLQECKCGDKICLQIHTYPYGSDAIDVRNRLVIKRRNKTSKVSYTIHVIISATGFPDLNSAVNVDVLDSGDVQIFCRRFEWRTRKTKQKHSDLKRDLTEMGNPKKVFSDEGLLLGNLSEEEKSNLLVYFDVIEK